MKTKSMLVIALMAVVGALSLVCNAPVQKTSVPLNDVQTSATHLFPPVALSGGSQFVEKTYIDSSEAIRFARSQFVEMTDKSSGEAIRVAAVTFK